ncbi:iron chaperone [Pedobacter sp. SYP-B3415]|uniref:iron chaperone n=1 Tax=Pedobacter sp. SYP-B3415 TaxID=2496641 RepID=UPI00101C7A86|nr:DUF1801 domain-containing protein [Pedobacter sp. SYP-B3415]
MKKQEDLPETVEEYISARSMEAARSLRETRAQITSLVPGATELISYQIPTVKYRDAPLLAYAAYPAHCSLYTMSKEIMHRYRDELKTYKTTLVAIHFKPGTTLPDTLVAKIVADRMAETDMMLRERELRKQEKRAAGKKWQV